MCLQHAAHVRTLQQTRVGLGSNVCVLLQTRVHVSANECTCMACARILQACAFHGSLTNSYLRSLTYESARACIYVCYYIPVHVYICIHLYALYALVHMCIKGAWLTMIACVHYAWFTNTYIKGAWLTMIACVYYAWFTNTYTCTCAINYMLLCTCTILHAFACLQTCVCMSVTHVRLLLCTRAFVPSHAFMSFFTCDVRDKHV